jgi:hypothetical protein
MCVPIAWQRHGCRVERRVLPRAFRLPHPPEPFKVLRFVAAHDDGVVLVGGIRRLPVRPVTSLRMICPRSRPR